MSDIPRLISALTKAKQGQGIASKISVRAIEAQISAILATHNTKG